MRFVQLFILCSLLLLGCQVQDTDSVSSGQSTQVIDPETGTKLTVWAPTDSISTAERLAINVEIHWIKPNEIELVEPVWNETQWSLIQSNQEPTRVDGDGFITSHHYLIEPFLPGKYTVPVFGLEITINPDEAARTITTLPLDIQVVSVLAAEDAGELEPVAQLYEPVDAVASQSTNQAVYWALGGGLVLSGLIIYLLTRSTNQDTKNRSAYALLEEVARIKDGQCPQAYETLYLALCKLDPRLQHTSEIRVLIEQCERIRFSHDQAGELDAKQMARHTLDLLGTSGSEAA
tara:strand:+ start:113411 stop:114283 length:873 start_codon:yes stop_codon:yes gene_type:complete